MPAATVSASAAPRRLLIVDDDPGQRSLLESFLRSQGFQTHVVASGETALAALRDGTFDLMISDVRMPGMTGLETLRRARHISARLPVLLVTAYADIREAVGAMRDGAVNYLSKPIDLDELLACIRHAIGASGPSTSRVDLDRPLPSSVIAVSPLMQAVLKDAASVAPSDCRVLLTGESGVGKEVVADLIHAWSPRASGPLVKLNCAAIPETLLESELFGHVKGAFTGAIAARVGRFEEADGGTLLLDEIGEMSPALQAKLLRVTQDGRFQRVGARQESYSNSRLLAATNRNLEEAVTEGRFREDLFYRLNVVELDVPPLRERPEDILPLAERFASDFSRGSARLSPAFVTCIQRYRWPGNVRELRNAMERATLLGHGDLLLPAHLPARIWQASLGEGDTELFDNQRLEAIEREAIFAALRQNEFNRTTTALALGISRRALQYKLQRFREMGFATGFVKSKEA